MRVPINRRLYNGIHTHHRCLSFKLSAQPEITIPRSISLTEEREPGLHLLQNLLQRCVLEKSLSKGKSYHAHIIQNRLQTDTKLSNILINMYWKCGSLDYARFVFDSMPQKSLVSWNMIIGGYTQNGEEDQAMKLFLKMMREKVTPSEFSLSSILCACSAKLALEESKQLHAFAIKTSFYTNTYVGTSLLDIYAKCNLIDDSSLVFDEMPERSEVSWSLMISGYVNNDECEEALKLFGISLSRGFAVTEFSLSSSLSACASLAALIEGNQLHALAIRSGFLLNLFVDASLIDMYAKSGSIEESYKVFSSLIDRNVVIWNAMISGFSKHACGIQALMMFEKMKQIGLEPNRTTYTSLLSACAHSGLVEEGQRHFALMARDFEPDVHHYACIVDLLGRAGFIDEAKRLIDLMPFEPTPSIWGSLLGASRFYKNLSLAEIAAKNLFMIEPNNAGNHVLLSNIYASDERWEEVARVRKALKDSGTKKEKGQSWIEVMGHVHVFVVGDRSHPRIVEVCERLERLIGEIERAGYERELQFDLHDVGRERKKKLLVHHSEKLALAFGLMSLSKAAPLRIMKNLRICGDCHSMMKFASKIEPRVIVLRDTSRFHHFRDGSCSCGDYW
ncbi:pentatricopeptide repeat-containing protein At5g04780 [Amborella trichopoda]|uniref:DYW domain-containing protein n=1 Tax=Amborella trichopoda TaxID=13333 RepID=W1NPK0_AMBTC|nr:pentatricopeptide repeat-containing protein At5g04780 [Amborella trichopoda]ERM98631.1 hypothetical protein AMTR_s00109p00094190 [Amborella trichopoda]|eukprot:XP_006833353.3 pentatricopeptide repeat-containing protein At5g04780 [Amborella trichopoda]